MFGLGIGGSWVVRYLREKECRNIGVLFVFAWLGVGGVGGGGAIGGLGGRDSPR
jgi:hypothetical protein